MRVRRPFSEAEISAWRERIFANSSEDPVRVAVAEAVKDLAEIIAATKPDPYATKRIYAACDWEHDEKRYEQKLNKALKKLSKKEQVFVRAVLNGRTWREMGLSRQLFSWHVKKIEKFFR